MKAFGWLLSVVGSVLAFYGAFIGNKVYGGLYVGYQRVMHMPSIMFGGLMLLVGVMLILASNFNKKNNDETTETIKSNEKFNGMATLDNDGYKIYLTKKYDIIFNNALNKFICKDKLFDSVDDALIYAKEINWDELGIVNGIIKAKENYDGFLVCPVCDATNNTERKNCRLCNYELIVDETNPTLTTKTDDGAWIALKVVGVIVFLLFIWWMAI